MDVEEGRESESQTLADMLKSSARTPPLSRVLRVAQGDDVWTEDERHERRLSESWLTMEASVSAQLAAEFKHRGQVVESRQALDRTVATICEISDTEVRKRVLLNLTPPPPDWLWEQLCAETFETSIDSVRLAMATDVQDRQPRSVIGRWIWMAMAASILIFGGIGIWELIDPDNPIDELSGDERALVASVPLSDQAAAQKIVTQRRFPRPAIMAVFWGKSGSGEPDPYQDIQSPVMTVVNDVRPVFRWIDQDGAREYRVFLFHQGKLVQSSFSRKTEWQPVEPLERGQVYSWNVVCHLDDEREFMLVDDKMRPRFSVISNELRLDLERELESGDSTPLARCMALVRYGLFDEALTVVDDRIQEDAQTEIWRSLRADIRRMQRQGS